MDPAHHQLHPPAKRRRLDGTPETRAFPAGQQIREDNTLYSCYSTDHIPHGVYRPTPQACPAPESLNLPSIRPLLNPAPQGHENPLLSSNFSVSPYVAPYQKQEIPSTQFEGNYFGNQPGSTWHHPERFFPGPSWPPNFPVPVSGESFVNPIHHQQSHNTQTFQLSHHQYLVSPIPVIPSSQPPLEPFPAEAPRAFILRNDIAPRQPVESAIVQSSETAIDTSSVVCFGMVPGISARCEGRDLGEITSSPFEVVLDSSNSFSAGGGLKTHGQILSDYGQMVQGLLDDETLALFTSCTITDPRMTKKGSKSSILLDSTLEITVYGPLDLFEEIGSWFEEYGVYLQDPRKCHLDVRYCNPQRLSSDDIGSCPSVLEAVAQTSRSISLQEIPERPELLDVLSSYIDIPETPQPSVILGNLKRHQKQALTFMLRRERGWNFSNQHPDIWEIVDTEQGRIFFNRVSGAHQLEEPQQFCGGIVADPMGLGKTLTMIALAATDLDGDDAQVHLGVGGDNKRHTPATLIVVPPPLLGTWEEQLSEHVIEGGLKCRRHHDKARLTATGELDGVNIVLTTYHTISAEWNAGRGVENSIIFSTCWRRIVLDEAHFIRNGNSRMAHAICALDSVSRWAVTGTPIQNRLGDLASLFKFIRAHPYTDPKCFEADISRLWKLGEDEEAVNRLKRLSACLLLRRAKDTIKLPARRDMQCPVDFNREERTLYDKVRQKAVISINEALQGDSEQARAGVYVNVLQQIESLRLICNLGVHYHTRQSNLSQPSQETDDWSNIAQQTFNVQREMAPVVCLRCSSVPDLTETLLDDPVARQQGPQFTRCLKFVCGDCTQKSSKHKSSVACGHKPPCPVASVSTSSSVLESSPCLILPQTRTTSITLSSKIEALVADIKTLPPGAKCIVFSTWRLTLDLIEAGLEQASLPSVRFDGKVPQKERQNVVERFKTDPNVRIMLLTLSCGAVGQVTSQMNSQW
ncbi:hypothetical protein AUP68_13471 [Ilyonectria robusta]